MKKQKIILSTFLLINVGFCFAQTTSAISNNSKTLNLSQSMAGTSKNSRIPLKSQNADSTKPANIVGNKLQNNSVKGNIGTNIISFEDNNKNGSQLVFKNDGSKNNWIMSGTANGNSSEATFNFNYSLAGDVLTMAPNGNVGIGTTTPDYKLDVLGTIRAEELIVETGWADFVFEENYKLLKLNEVEKYIKQNKHLVGIPSSNEIKKNGASVAELMTKMMVKIEELTLYTIQLQKEIDALKKAK